MKRTIFVLAIVTILAASTQAEVITIFDSNSIITAVDTYDTVVVKGDGTVVDMTGGTVNRLITMNASTFNMLGGSIDGGGWPTVASHDSSVLNLSGGTLGSLHGYGNSTVNVSGSALIGNGSLYNSSRCTFSGGSSGEMAMSGHSILKIKDGTVTSIWFFDGSTRVDLSGGTVDVLFVDSTGFAGVIRVVGYDLDAVPYGGDSGDGEVTGYWNNDAPFSLSMDSRAYSHLELYDGITPVDCSNPPEGDISGDCIVNMLDLSKIASEWLQDGTE